MNDWISHTAYKILTAYNGWDSDFVWGISNSNIKSSSIFHESSGINDGILPTWRSGNGIWVGVDWFCTHQAGRNLSLDVINFGSRLLPLPYLTNLREWLALIQLPLLIKLGSWYVYSICSDTIAFESKYMAQCLVGIFPIEVLSLFYAARMEAPPHPLPINHNFIFNEREDSYLCQRWRTPFFIIVNIHVRMAVSQDQLYLWRYWSYGNKKHRFQKTTSNSWNTRSSITPECRLTWS